MAMYTAIRIRLVMTAAFSAATDIYRHFANSMHVHRIREMTVAIPHDMKPVAEYIYGNQAHEIEGMIWVQGRQSDE
jgi:hypothetical protein